MQQLKKLIKDKKIEGLFLFYGEEMYILNAYLNKSVDIALQDSDRVMNLDVFEEASADFERVLDAMNTLPFFGDKRVIILKALDLFNTKNATKVEKLMVALEHIPDTTVLFVIEPEIDKRGKLYKKFNTKGKCVEFKSLSEDDLIQYIADQLNKKGKKIEKSVARYFINSVGYDLTTVHNELEKVVSYSSDQEIIDQKGIDDICTKSVENRIFELVECMGSKKRALAIKLYRDLLLLKEPPMRVLFMITRQFRLILQTKLLVGKKLDSSSIASKLKIPPFVVDKNLRQAKSFTEEQLKQALKECLDAEVAMKTGKMDIELGLEMLIIKYSH